MTPSQAAPIIGVSQQQVRWLIRAGKLPATRVAANANDYRHGWEYDIKREDVIAARDKRKKRLRRVKVGQGNYPRN